MADRLYASDFTAVANKPPARQGFYTVSLGNPNGDQLIAEWREYDKSQGKRWWQHLADDPTQPKVPVPLDGVTHYAPASKTAVEDALRREPTVAEHLDAAYKHFLTQHNVPPESIPAVPARRRLQVGDEVERGLSKGLRVEELRDDGRVVLLSSMTTKEPIKKVYSSAPWYILVKTPAVPVATERVKAPKGLNNAFTGCDLSELMKRYIEDLDVNPKYQRGYAWTREDKMRLLATLLDGRDLGRFIIIRREYPERDEVLDGKQRLSTLVQFYLGELDFNGLYWDDLTQSDRQRILRRQVQVAKPRGADLKESDIYAIFLEVNAAGVPQTEEHLAGVQRLYEEALAREAAAVQNSAS